MLSQMQKKLFKKRTVRRLMLTTPNGMNIGICAYALFRPQMPGVLWKVHVFILHSDVIN